MLSFSVSVSTSSSTTLTAPFYTHCHSPSRISLMACQQSLIIPRVLMKMEARPMGSSLKSTRTKSRTPGSTRLGRPRRGPMVIARTMRGPLTYQPERCPRTSTIQRRARFVFGSFSSFEEVTTNVLRLYSLSARSGYPGMLLGWPTRKFTASVRMASKPRQRMQTSPRRAKSSSQVVHLGSRSDGDQLDEPIYLSPHILACVIPFSRPWSTFLAFKHDCCARSLFVRYLIDH